MPRQKTGEKDKSAFVTGGSGKLGRSVIERLLSHGYNVKALVNKKERIVVLPAGVIPIVGDINDSKVLRIGCEDVDFVFHSAAIVSEYRSTTDALIRTNVNGTVTLIDACRDAGVRRLLFPSTIDVYGRVRNTVLDEDSKPMPSDKYGYSKLLAEEEITKSSSKVDYTIFRLATVYGDKFEAQFFKMFGAIKQNRFRLIGSGDNHLAIIHIMDLLDALLLAIENPVSIGKIYNLSDGTDYTQKFLINMAADLLRASRPSKNINPIIVKMIAKKHNLDSDELRFITSNRIISIKKIREELGFSPKVDVIKAAKELVAKYSAKEQA
jgi:UDP-glucose 4-epimerase